jgi:Protein of unknown function (DUF1566)
LDKTAPAAADGKLGFSYSEVPNPAGGTFPKTDCVKDNLTGLVWESKTTSGLRNKDISYSNQIDDLGLNGFISKVNATSLCGYTDWRLPTVDELHSIVDYSVVEPVSKVDANWFPNTRSGKYWSSSAPVVAPDNAFFVSFFDGTVSDSTRNTTYPMRLVRGATAVSQYTVSANGQEVTDSKTGLIWRRCSEGQTWSGSACTGSPSGYTHEAALAQATAQTLATNVAWRLPNIKELASIVDNTKANPAINRTAFPQTPATDIFWSSSPYIYLPDASYARVVYFSNGSVDYLNRGATPFVRFVRSSP